MSRRPIHSSHLLLIFLVVLGLHHSPTGAQESAPLTLVRAFEEHRNSLFTISESPDRQWFVSGGAEKKIILWSRESLKPVAENSDGKGKVLCSQFSHDSRYVLSTCDPKSIRVLAVPSLKEIRFIELPFRPIRVAAMPRMPLCAVCGSGDQVYLINYRTGQVISKFKGQEKNNQALLFSPDGGLIYVAGETKSGAGRLIAHATRGSERNLDLGELNGRPNCLRFNAKRDLCMVANSEACVLDRRTGKRIQTWTSPRKTDFLSIRYWAEKDLYVTSDRKGYLDFWRMGRDQPVAQHQISTTTAHDVLTYGSGQLIAVTQQAKRSLKLWKVNLPGKAATNQSPPANAGQQPVYSIKKPLAYVSIVGERIRVIGSSENAEELAVAFESGRVSTFDMKQKRKLASVELIGSTVLGFTYCPSRDSIYMRTAGKHYWVTPSTGAIRKSYVSGVDSVPGKSSISRSGRLLASPAVAGIELVSTSFRGSASLQAAPAKNRADRHFTATAFSRSKDIVAGARRDGVIFFWKGDPLIGEPGRIPVYQSLGAIRQPRETILDLHFNEEKLATLSEKGNLRVWNGAGKIEREINLGELKFGEFLAREKQVAFVSAKDSETIQIRSYEDGQQKQLKLVSSFNIHDGLPVDEKLTIAFMEFRKDGKRLAVGFNSADANIKRCYVAIYRTEK